MRAIAGLLAFMTIVLIAVLMLIYEWIRKRKNNFRWLWKGKYYQPGIFFANGKLL